MTVTLQTLEAREAQSRRDAEVLLAVCEGRFVKGDQAALLDAVNWCAVHGVPLLCWAATAFEAAYRSVKYDLQHYSWDDVFGRPHAGRKLSALQKHNKLCWIVYQRVQMLRARKPKPPEIFQKVAADFDISVATCKRYYDDRKAWLEEAWKRGQEQLERHDAAEAQQIAK